MKGIKYITVILFVALFAGQITAQRRMPSITKEYDNSGSALKMGFHLGFMFPGHDFAERYGRFNTVGVDIDFNLPDSKWAIGLGLYHQFGQNVKDDVLENLRDRNGEVIGLNKALATIVLRQRGWHFYGKIDRLFFAGASYKTGLLVSLRPGFFQHYVRLQDEDNAVPHVRGEYKAGYDRMVFGPSLTQFIGYQYMSPKRTFNFYAGIEATQAFTMERRDYFFSRPGEVIPKDRFDSTFGFKIGWILPIYFVSNPSEIFY